MRQYHRVVVNAVLRHSIGEVNRSLALNLEILVNVRSSNQTLIIPILEVARSGQCVSCVARKCGGEKIHGETRVMTISYPFYTYSTAFKLLEKRAINSNI